MSRRSSPELPPSSAIVTTAVRLLVWAFMPRSSAASPLPPPTATTRGPRASRPAARISAAVSGPARWEIRALRAPMNSTMAPKATPSNARSAAAACLFCSQPMPRPRTSCGDQKTPTAKIAE